MAVVTSAQHGRLEEVAAAFVAGAAAQQARPVGQRVGDMRLDLGEAGGVDQRPCATPFPVPAPTCNWP